MPTDQLPRRPYVELPPPPDGFGGAVAEARRRRRRRALVAAAGTSATAAVVGILVLVIGGGPGGDAILRPAPVPPAGHLATPAPTSVAASAPAALTPGQHRLAAPGSSAGAAPTTGRSQPGVQPSAGQAAPVVLTRTRGSYAGSPRVCRTGDTLDDSSFTPGQNWCSDAAATPVAGGVRLSLTMCRDSTSAGTLTFARSREVDLAVKRGSKVVWSWSHDHPGTSSRHTLNTDADGCWTWSLVWPDVTQSGAPAGHGAYTLVASSTADELRGDTSTTATFDY